MSAFVLKQEHIETLTLATNAMLTLNKKYPASYHLEKRTVEILGKYTGDLHNIYRALYITNIKAVNGRYGEDQKTLPKYKKLTPWRDDWISLNDVKEACKIFRSYEYQICEDPIYGTDIYNAFQDIRKALCTYYMDRIDD